MPANQYENATLADGNANDQSARVTTEQNASNAVQQQVQAAQQAAAPDPAIQAEQDRQDQQIRKQQNAGMSMSVW
jgi:hypothetical protein